jgi:GNAT superfamily N-acetyltransferase
MPEARLAQTADLEGLLDLFRGAEVSPVAEPLARAQHIWNDMMARKDIAVFVSDADGLIAATCTLVTAPNLLREGRGHGFIENVVTRAEFRGQGHGQAVIRAALAKAWEDDCFHVLLQSGRTDPRVHHFYAQCGFKTGLRTGYVAHRPR